MTAAHHIAAAQRILSRGGQPGLATLHMRRAAEYLDTERATIKQDYRKARIKADPVNSIRFAGQDMADSISRAAEGIKAAWRVMMPSLAHLANASQADFTLAGPSKGGGA